MLIIAEGTDGTGKTTLLSKIHERIAGLDPLADVRVLHRGPPKRHPLYEYEEDLLDYRPGSGAHVLCDRWHWGELVYAVLYRDGSLLDAGNGAGRRHVELFLRSRGALMLHVRAPAGIVRRRLEERGEDYLKMEHLEWTLDAFTGAALRTQLVTKNVYTHREIDVDSIIRWASDLELEHAPLARFPMYIGHRHPDVLLVGEKKGGDEPTIELPFTPLPSTSGRYLLDAVGDDHTALGVTNAYEEDVRPLWVTLGRPHVCALGRRAQAKLREIGVPHGVAPHPQYVRRFHHRRRDAYGRIIRQAAYSGEDYGSWPNR